MKRKMKSIKEPRKNPLPLKSKGTILENFGKLVRITKKSVNKN